MGSFAIEREKNYHRVGEKLISRGWKECARARKRPNKSLYCGESGGDEKTDGECTHRFYFRLTANFLFATIVTDRIYSRLYIYMDISRGFFLPPAAESSRILRASYCRKNKRKIRGGGGYNLSIRIRFALSRLNL